MSKEQASTNKEKENIGAIEAYEILLRRQISEDRIVTERTNIFLAGSSFLFLAFVMLLTSNQDTIIFIWLRILLSIVGIFLAFLLYCLNRSAINALNSWHIGQEKIEKEAPEFAYMRENEIAPHITPIQRPGEKRSWLKKSPLTIEIIYAVSLPLTFFLLWLGSLVAAVLL